MFNFADYVILGVLVLSTLVSLARGFVREAFSLVTWVAAFWIAFTFCEAMSSLLVSVIHASSLRAIVSFGILFLATLILGAFINHLIGAFVDKTGLSGTDRVLGLIFGFARGVLLVTVALMLARLTPAPQDPWWKGSILIPHFLPIEMWIRSLLPEFVTQHLTLTY